MPSSTTGGWFPRLLFRLSFLMAALLAGLVILSPVLDNGKGQPGGWSRVLAVFARDLTLRRTALASAAGLCVTACVFFRPGPGSQSSKPKPKKQPPPATMIGA